MAVSAGLFLNTVKKLHVGKTGNHRAAGKSEIPEFRDEKPPFHIRIRAGRIMHGM